MTVKKLTEADKLEILKLYRQTPETTSTLAERYGVSNSTISRLLKSTLPEDEYETLIAAKRAARTPHSEAVQMQLLSEPAPELAVPEPDEVVELSPEPIDRSTPAPRKRRRSSAPLKPKLDKSTPIAATTEPEPISPPLTLDLDTQATGTEGPTTVVTSSSPEPLDEDTDADASAIAEMLGEELLDESDDITGADEDDDDDFDEEEEDDLGSYTPPVKRRLPVETLIQVLPLSEANLPKTCYLVIDRAAELITRPLQDFGDLGQIPTQEVQERTLPVFDNHRVARRFSNKRERVIKVPDSKVLQKARPHLQAKGITRLLVDGQVYSLVTN